MYFGWTVPDEIAHFIKNEYDRFGMPIPSNRAINEIADMVLMYIAKSDYSLPREELVHRYYHAPGLSESEKNVIMTPIMIHVMDGLGENITIDQVDLGVWAALMFCWSDEGEQYVIYYKCEKTG